jgi:hypothetical protein
MAVGCAEKGKVAFFVADNFSITNWRSQPHSFGAVAAAVKCGSEICVGSGSHGLLQGTGAAAD